MQKGLLARSGRLHAEWRSLTSGCSSLGAPTGADLRPSDDGGTTCFIIERVRSLFHENFVTGTCMQRNGNLIGHRS